MFTLKYTALISAGFISGAIFMHYIGYIVFGLYVLTIPFTGG